MKRFMRVLMVCLFSLILFGCAKEDSQPEIDSRVVPVYEGMAFQEELLNPVRYQSSDDYGDLIPDLGEDSRVSYFAKPAEAINIEIHLHNPDQFEILSLTLNERKYQSFEFKEGSTGEKLILGVTAPNKPGEYVYEIAKIKYIDGNDIRDVDMSNGNKTIDFGVTYLNMPEIKVYNEAITTTSFSASVSAIDNDGALAKSQGLTCYLFDIDHRLIQKSKVEDGFEFSGLKGGFSYHYAIAMSFDALDGKGSKTRILYEGDFDALANIGFKKVNAFETSLEYEVYKENPNVVLDNILLYDAKEFVDITDKNKVEGLLTNHEYKLEINYTLDGNKLKTIKMIKTGSLEKPTIAGFSVEANKNEIAFDYSYGDLNKVIKNAYVRLYLDGVLKQEIKPTEHKLEGLLSDTLYDVDLVLEYDLNDGNGIQEVVERKSVKTLPLEKPMVGISYTLEENIFKGTVSVIDNDKTYKFDHFELCDSQGNLINRLDSIAEINSLKRNTNYQIKLAYYYNLNDGKPDTKAEYILEFTTTKQIPELKIEEFYIKNDSFGLDIYETDPNVIGELSGIRLFDAKDNFLRAIPVSNSIEFSELSANTKYKVKLYYAYDLDDGNGNQEIIYTHEIATAKNLPELDFTLEALKKEISVDLSITDIDKAGEITNVILSHEGKEISSGKALSFKDLLSNNSYKVRVEYTYNLNDLTGKHTIVLEKEIVTASLEAPEITASLAKNDYRSLSFKYDLKDSDHIFKFNKAILSLNGNEVKALKLDSLEANELYTNNEYELTLYYQYDLNDGSGIHNEELKLKARTLKYADVNLSYNKLMATENSISFDYLINDSSKSLEITKIELYDNENKLVETLSDLSLREFKNLNKGSFYKIITSYTYDLLDGKGVISDQSTQEYGTIGSKLFIEEIRVLNNEAILVGDKVHINVRLANPNNLYVTGLYFNDYRFDITQHDIENNFVNATFVPDFDGGLYDIVLTGYSYLVKNGDKEIELTENLFESYKAQVPVLGKLNILEYGTTNKYPYSVINNKDIYLKYDGSKNYLIEEITTECGTINKENIDFISANEVRFSIGITSHFPTITSIKYSLDGYSTRLEMNLIANFFVVNDSNINHLSKPSDFNSLKDYSVYVLDNDIDFANYNSEIDKNFTGVLIGNNHKILNFKKVVPGIVESGNLGLFERIYGYVEGIELVNFYIYAEKTNSDTYVGALAGTMTGVMKNITITNAKIKANACVGGIAGIIKDSQVTNCKVDYNSQIIGNNMVGGLFGSLNGGNNVRLFKNVQNEASVSGASLVGGIAGQVTGDNVTFDGAYNSGSISANSVTAGGIIGEIVGYSTDYTIRNVLNVGKVCSPKFVAGIIGYCNTTYTEIVNAINLGELALTGDISGYTEKTSICSYFNFGQGLIKNTYANSNLKFDGNNNEKFYQDVYNDNKDGLHYIDQISLNSKEFWLELEFDEAIWSLDLLDTSKELYPSLRFVK